MVGIVGGVGGGVSSWFALPLVGIAPTLLGHMPWRQRCRFLARHSVTTHGAGWIVCRRIARLRMKLSLVWLVVLLIVAWRGAPSFRLGNLPSPPGILRRYRSDQRTWRGPYPWQVAPWAGRAP